MCIYTHINIYICWAIHLHICIYVRSWDVRIQRASYNLTYYWNMISYDRKSFPTADNHFPPRLYPHKSTLSTNLWYDTVIWNFDQTLQPPGGYPRFIDIISIYRERDVHTQRDVSTYTIYTCMCIYIYVYMLLVSIDPWVWFGIYDETTRLRLRCAVLNSALLCCSRDCRTAMEREWNGDAKTNRLNFTYEGP